MLGAHRRGRGHRAENVGARGGTDGAAEAMGAPGGGVPGQGPDSQWESLTASCPQRGGAEGGVLAGERGQNLRPETVSHLPFPLGRLT